MRVLLITAALAASCAAPAQNSNQARPDPYPSEDPPEPEPPPPKPLPVELGQWGFSMDYPGQLVAVEREDDLLFIRVTESDEHGPGFELVVNRSIDEWDIEGASGQVIGNYEGDGYSIAQYIDYELFGRPAKAIIAYRMQYTSVALVMASDRCLYRIKLLATGQTESDNLEDSLQKVLDKVSLGFDATTPCTEPPSEEQVAAAAAEREAAAEAVRARRAISDEEVRAGVCSEERYAVIESVLDGLVPWLDGVGLYLAGQDIIVASPGGTRYEIFVVEGTAFHVFVAGSDEVSQLEVTDSAGSAFTSASPYAGVISNVIGGAEILSRGFWPVESGAVTATVTGHGCAMLLTTMSND